jgi:predicted kinase
VSLPLIIVVTGLPCTGKTTLARHLSRELNLPCFCRDTFKEILFDTLGYSDRDWSRRLGIASYALLYSAIEEQLRAGRSLIAESNFHPDAAGPAFASLRDKYAFDLVQILCTTTTPVLLQRFEQRATSGERHPGHVEQQSLDEFRTLLANAAAEPIPIQGDLITLDTSDLDQVDLASITRQVRSYIKE